MIQMGFHLKDFNPNSSLNDYFQGQQYTPLLFLALEHRSMASIKCLIELGLPITGCMYKTKFSINRNDGRVSFRSLTKETQCLDIMTMINDLKDDIELSNIFKQTLTSIETKSDEHFEKQKQIEDTNLEKSSKQRNRWKSFVARIESEKEPISETCILL